MITIKEELLFEMSNVRGKQVKNPHNLPFSFYFSSKDAVESKELKHGLKVKPLFNPEKMSIRLAGTLKLHGDWKFTPGKDDKNVDSSKVKEMKQFFKEYKILFSAVWEKQLPPDTLYDYFRGTVDFAEMLQEFEFYDDYKDVELVDGKLLKDIDNLKDLWQFVEQYDLFYTWNK